jgi:hypothetical protein
MAGNDRGKPYREGLLDRGRRELLKAAHSGSFASIVERVMRSQSERRRR